MADMDRFRGLFLDECDDLIARMEEQFAFVADNPPDSGTVDEIFRAIHSIKGGAGSFDLKALVAFAHRVETALDGLRRDHANAMPELAAAGLAVADLLADMTRAARDGTMVPADRAASVARALEAAAGQLLPDAMAPGQDAPAQGGKVETTYDIAFRPHAGMLRRANDPQLIFSHLASLGRLTVTADLSALPPLDALEPLTCHLGWSLVLETVADRLVVEEAFDFVAGDCDLTISAREPAAAGDQADGAAPDQRLAGPERSAVQTVRVDAARLDLLVNLVGEVVISQSIIAQQIDAALSESHPALADGMLQLIRHTQALQASVMAIRARPVRSVFGRMPRVVRDLVQRTGKAVQIEMAGGETEIDQSVIEELGDPLIHIIRNAIDHGIEDAAVRAAAGKPAEAVIQLSAEQRAGQIIIRVSDDGRGIDRARVRAVAEARGLISPDALLGDEETDALIFRPGFSTAESVTDVSGRGVGMDVVRQNIERLGGRVSVRSVPGRGATVSLILPLTLAVIDGMIVQVAGRAYVIPLASVLESAALDAVRELPGAGEVLRFRDGHVPLLRLGEAFGVTRADGEPEPLCVFIELPEGGVIALAVDEITGQQSVVIKSLEQNFGSVPGIGGATVLGDGTVALIIDPEGVVRTRTGTPSRRGRDLAA